MMGKSGNCPISKDGMNFYPVEHYAGAFLKKGLITGLIEDGFGYGEEFVTKYAAEGSYPVNYKEVLEKSPTNRLWDYKNSEYCTNNTKIYVFNNMAFAEDFAGNVYWGEIIANARWPLKISQLGAGLQQTGTGHSSFIYWVTNWRNLGDDKRDSEAINVGYIHVKK